MKQLNSPQPSTPPKQFDWAALYFTADADGEPFVDVNIKTLRSEFVEQAAMVVHNHSNATLAEIEEATARLISSGNAFPVQEYVDVLADGITICIHATTIDDEIIWAALEMLAEALDKLNGQMGRITFGAPTTFLSTEIPWLYRH